MAIHKLKSVKILGITADEYVGSDGSIFYDDTDGILRLSDGSTLGGAPIAEGIYHLGDDKQFVDIDPDNGIILIQSGFDAPIGNVYIKGSNCSEGGVGGNVIIEAGGAMLPNTGTTGNIELAAQQTTIESNNNMWTFRDDGVLELPIGGDIVDSDGNTVLGGTGGSTNELVNGDYYFTLGVDGTVNFDPSTNGKGVLQTTSDLQFIANTSTWTFGSDGSLQLPAGGIIKDSTGTNILDGLGGGSESYFGTVDKFLSVDSTYVVHSVNTGDNSFTVVGNAVADIMNLHHFNIDGYFSVGYQLPLLQPPTYDSGTGLTTIRIDDFDGDTVNNVWVGHNLRCVNRVDGPSQLGFSEAFTFDSFGGNLVGLKSINTLANGSYTVTLGSDGKVEMPSQWRIGNTSTKTSISNDGFAYNHDLWLRSGSATFISTDLDASADGNQWMFSGNGVQMPNTGGIYNTTTAVGVIYTFNLDASGNASAIDNTNGIWLATTSESIAIQAGWIITFANGSKYTVVANTVSVMPPHIGQHQITWTGNISLSDIDVWPLTIENPAYTDGITTKSLEISPDGTTTWTLGDDGSLTFPDDSVQTTAFTGGLTSPNSSYYFNIPNGGVQTNSPIKWMESTSERVVLNYVPADDRFVISTGRSGTSRYWYFGDDGTLKLPSGAGFGLGETSQLKVDDSSTTSLDFRDGTGRGFYTNGDGFTLRSNGSKNWKFDTTGMLTLPAATDNANIYRAGNIGIKTDGPSGGHQWTFDSDGNLTIPGEIKSVAGTGDVVIEANNGTARTWTFGQDGSTTLPNGVVIGKDTDGFISPSETNGVVGLKSQDGLSVFDVNNTYGARVRRWSAGHTNEKYWIFNDDGTLTFPDDTDQSTAFQDVPSHIFFVHPSPGRTFTQTGTYNSPFDTITKAINAAVTAGHSDSDPAVIILMANITENITLKPGIYLTSFGTGTHGSPTITGTVTVTSSTGNTVSNHYSISNLRIVGPTNGKALYFTGTAPQKLFVRDMWIDAHGTGTGVYMDNTGSGSTLQMDIAHLYHDGSGDIYCIDVVHGNCYVTDIETSGATQVAAVRAGCVLTIDSSELDAVGDVVCETYGSGSVTITNSIINNTQANGNGIKLNDAGGVATLGNNLISVPVGTGYVVQGVSGTFLVAAGNVFTTANTARSTAITYTALPTTWSTKS